MGWWKDKKYVGVLTANFALKIRKENHSYLSIPKGT